MDPDQTAPIAAVWSESTLFAGKASKTFQQTTKANNFSCDWWFKGFLIYICLDTREPDFGFATWLDLNQPAQLETSEKFNYHIFQRANTKGVDQPAHMHRLVIANLFLCCLREGAQWPQVRASPASLRCGPWARHIYPSLVLVQPRKTRPCLTERLLMGHKESNQTKLCCSHATKSGFLRQSPYKYSFLSRCWKAE